MRLLVTNFAPSNGGDEALGRAVIGSIIAKWPGIDVTVLCKNVEHAQIDLPRVGFDTDLDDLPRLPVRSLSRKTWSLACRSRKIPGLARLTYATDALVRRYGQSHIKELYRAADIVASAPGGFLNDYYPIETRLNGLGMALKLGKPVMTFPQSFGPFWKPESMIKVREILNQINTICVRDEASRNHLIECGVEPHRVWFTADAAFLWRSLDPGLFRPRTGTARKIGLCFREWPLGDTAGTEATVQKAVALCTDLLSDPARELHFISTCQGIPGYIDDSLVARRVIERLSPHQRERCVIASRRHTTLELFAALRELDAFIGMRLHGCILAMLVGTPAMGLGYERKTAEIFRQLGLDAYQVPFVSPQDEWIDLARRFTSHCPEIHAALPAALDDAMRRAMIVLDAFATCAGLDAERSPA